MKKLLLSIMMFLTVMAFASAGSVTIDRLSTDVYDYDGGRDVMTAVSFENDLGFATSDSKVTVSIPELGIYRRVSVQEFNNGDAVTKIVLNEIPYEINPGYYIVRVVISGDQFSRITHREVYLG